MIVVLILSRIHMVRCYWQDVRLLVVSKGKIHRVGRLDLQMLVYVGC